MRVPLGPFAVCTRLKGSAKGARTAYPFFPEESSPSSILYRSVYRVRASSPEIRMQEPIL